MARITKALAFVYDTGWRHSAGEVYRVRGPLALQAKDQGRRSKVNLRPTSSSRSRWDIIVSALR